MEKRVVITVDGLAGTGKTTLSKKLAERLGYRHFSSGILYRAVGAIALRAGYDLQDSLAVGKILKEHTLELIGVKEYGSQIVVDGQPVGSDTLYGPEVSEATSIIAQLEQIRADLIAVQREVFPGENLVAEGRDMGTTIFPDAPLKFFVTIQEEVAIERRLTQIVAARGNISESELKSLKERMKIEISERDARDRARKVSPTLPAEDAIVIDNSSETLTRVVQNMYDAASERGLS